MSMLLDLGRESVEEDAGNSVGHDSSNTNILQHLPRAVLIDVARYYDKFQEIGWRYISSNACNVMSQW